jgi:DNA-directed RNA polymerase alpha subunit
MNININEIGSFSQLFTNVIFTALEFRQVSVEGLLKKLHTHFEQKFGSEQRGCYAANVTYKRFTEDRLDVRAVSDILQALDVELSFGLTTQELAPPQQAGEMKAEATPAITSYPAIWDDEIHVLNMPVRATNCVRFGGPNEIRYIGELIQLSVNEVRKFVNIGAVTLGHIVVGLTEKGLKFETNVGNWLSPRQREWLNKPCSALGFNHSSFNSALAKKGITKVHQLVAMTEEQLNEIYSLPPANGHSLTAHLRSADLKLGMDLNGFTPSE